MVRATEYSDSHIIRSLRGLENIKFLTVKKPNFGTRKTYKINWEKINSTLNHKSTEATQ